MTPHYATWRGVNQLNFWRATGFKATSKQKFGRQTIIKYTSKMTSKIFGYLMKTKLTPRYALGVVDL
jgi:hypothetical protein